MSPGISRMSRSVWVPAFAGTTKDDGSIAKFSGSLVKQPVRHRERQRSDPGWIASSLQRKSLRDFVASSSQ